MMESRSNRNTTGEAFLSAIFFIIFLIFFGIYTNNSKYYTPCSKESDTYRWYFITFLLLCASFFFQVILVPVAVHVKNAYCDCLAHLFELTTFIMNLVCYGELIKAYKHEECGDLTILMLIYIIIISVVLSIGLFMILSFMCLCLCSSLGLFSLGKLQANANSNSTIIPNKYGAIENADEKV